MPPLDHHFAITRPLLHHYYRDRHRRPGDAEQTNSGRDLPQARLREKERPRPGSDYKRSMATLGPAHKGYLYQDIASAYFLGRSLVEPVRTTTVDWKFHPDDRFDDLLVVQDDGRRVRRQFKHSVSPAPFERSHLNSDRSDLKLDRLIRSWRQDSAGVRAQEYRICVTWLVPTEADDLNLLVPANELGSFGGASRPFRLAVDTIWPKRGQPLLSCLRGTSRREYVKFSKLLVLELECPAASLDLEHPGPIERLLVNLLGDRVGFGRYPNETPGPVDAAARLIVIAARTRSADASESTLTPHVLAGRLGLVTDYGKLPQQFPFHEELFVPVPKLRRQLLQRIRAGGITVLAGGPGAGKSWELTALMRKLRASGAVVACHYCYLSPGDPQVQSRITLNAFYGNLMAGIVDSMPELRDANEARYAAGAKELQWLLNEAARLQPGKRLVVIVDGLDHIARVLRDAPSIAAEETHIARDLLALTLPPSVSVIVGSQPGDHVTQLAAAGTVLTVPRWDESAARAFLRLIPLGRKLAQRKIGREVLSELITELTSRSQGNALYCTFLCRELEQRLLADPTAQPLILLRTLPVSNGSLATYYNFLLGSLDGGGALVAEAIGLIDFAITPAELVEIFPHLQGHAAPFLRQVAPILEETRGRGGLRIYHESFRRHILDKTRLEPAGFGPKLGPVITWLEARGFVKDARAFRFLLPNLVRADRHAEVLGRIGRDFVVASVAAGHPSSAIDANLTLFASAAAAAQDFPMLIRATELARAVGTLHGNLHDYLEYGSTFATIFGVDRLMERLTFDGAPTLKVADGLKLCSFCADAGANPPWEAYMSKPLPTEDQQRDMQADMAKFHGLVREGAGKKLRQRIIKWLRKIGDKADRRYLENVVRRWREVAGANDLQAVRREAKCTGEIAVAFDLEFARATGSTTLRKAAATRAGRRTKNPARAIEALKLGASPARLAHHASRLEDHHIGVNGRGLTEAEPLERWISGIRIAAFVEPRVLAAERIRIRGAGWYRYWLGFVITLAEIERRAVRRPDEAADDVVDALRELTVDTHPFCGEPRTCDLFHATLAISDSFHRALALIQTSQQWRSALHSLKAVSSGTTTRLDRSQGGPLTPSRLFDLVAPFAERPDLRGLIRRAIEPLVDRQHVANIYNEIASDEMRFASLLVKIGDQAGAEAHWQKVCLSLCAYGMRKDVTIYEILDNVRALERAGKSAVLERLAKLQALVYAVVLHTDGRETSHSVSKWFRKLAATDEIAAASLLGHSMADEGGKVDYRLEEGLEHWTKAAGDFDVSWRSRIELVTEGPIGADIVRARLTHLETLHAIDPGAAALELQLLAATVHGDPMALPQESYRLLQDFATRHGLSLPSGQPDLTFPAREEDRFPTEPDPVRPPLNWPAPASPADMLRQLREAVGSSEITNQQLLDYCRPRFRDWADAHRPELEEVLSSIARGNRFRDRERLLADLGIYLEAEGKAELAARALTLAYACSRGGGGWLSLGGEEQEDLLIRALRASRPVMLAVLANEIALRVGGWGITRHLVGFFGRHDDINLAVAMWDEACAVITYRLPGNEQAVGPFVKFDPAQTPAWSREDAALFLILARIAHPEKRRKTNALAQAAWLVEREGARCALAFRGILQAAPCFTHQLWLLQLLGQFESPPFALSRALAPELNTLVGSGKAGTELLAQQLLLRAGMPVTGTVVRNNPIVTVSASDEQKRRALLSDSEEVISKVEELWPEFSDLVASRFETVMRSSEDHKQRIKDRWETRMSRVHTTYPSARFHGWEDELFYDALNQVATGLERYLFARGEWDDDIWPRLLSWLLPDAEIPVRHVFSRRVRPSWPLPAELAPGVGAVPTVPDGDLSGWVRLAFFETHLDVGDSTLNEIRTKSEVFAGVVLAETVAPLPATAIPFTGPERAAWLQPFARTMPLKDFTGPCASIEAFGHNFAFHMILAVSPRLLASLGLRPRTELGPLDLFEETGQLAVADRWWSSRPLGDHGFADENPRLFGAALLMRPDIFERIKAATRLEAFESLSIKVEQPDQRPNRR